MIARAAELGADDVVLEVGGGLGVLSEYLAERVAHVHVVELDRALEPALRDALDPHPNTTLHLADAVKLDLAALDPAPTKVVANLPYGVAATVILRTIEELPERDDAGSRWCRRRSASASPPRRARAAYGVPSVLAQLACDVRVLRPDLAQRLHPGAERRLGARRPARAAARRRRRRCARSCSSGFAHRRKALAALARARARRRPGDPRPRARGARGARPARRRARRAARARASGARCAERAALTLTALAPGKVNLCLFVGAPRADGLHPLVSRRPAGRRSPTS